MYLKLLRRGFHSVRSNTQSLIQHEAWLGRHEPDYFVVSQRFTQRPWMGVVRGSKRWMMSRSMLPKGEGPFWHGHELGIFHTSAHQASALMDGASGIQ